MRIQHLLAFLVVATFFAGFRLMAASPVDQIVSDALELYRSKDSVAAIAFVLDRPDAGQASRAFEGLVMRAYGQEKDLAATVAFSHAGLNLALDQARRAPDKDVAGIWLSTAKAFCYNLASFTWTGWNEPGIVIGPTDRQAGLDAARANLRLAQELAKGDEPLSTAWWMLGGQLLASGQPAGAKAAFVNGTAHAEKAGKPDHAALCQGFAALADALAEPTNAGRQEAVQQAIDKLKGTAGDGPFFAGQLVTAREVFSR